MISAENCTREWPVLGSRKYNCHDKRALGYAGNVLLGTLIQEVQVNHERFSNSHLLKLLLTDRQ